MQSVGNDKSAMIIYSLYASFTNVDLFLFPRFIKCTEIKLKRKQRERKKINISYEDIG